MTLAFRRAPTTGCLEVGASLIPVSESGAVEGALAVHKVQAQLTTLGAGRIPPVQVTIHKLPHTLFEQKDVVFELSFSMLFS